MHDQGGRLTPKLIESLQEKIKPVFDNDDDIVELIPIAVEKKQTLLIENGGPRLMPARKLGHEAYAKWLAEFSRGFINPDINS